MLDLTLPMREEQEEDDTGEWVDRNFLPVLPLPRTLYPPPSTFTPSEIHRDKGDKSFPEEGEEKEGENEETGIKFVTYFCIGLVASVGAPWTLEYLQLTLLSFS